MNIYFPLPKSISYTNPLVAIVNEPIEPSSPVIDGETTTEYQPTVEINYGNYDRGYVTFNLTVISTKPACLPDGDWPVTSYGSIATLRCEDPLIGFRTRECNKNNLTGEGEWEENEVNGCISTDNSIIDKDTAKIIFNITLQGKTIDSYGNDEIIAIAEVIVRLVNRDDINMTNIAVVLIDETVYNSNYTRRNRVLQTIGVVLAKVTITTTTTIINELSNEISALNGDTSSHLLEEFSKSSNEVLKTIDFVEISQGEIIKLNTEDDEDSDDDTMLYIIIGASCGGVVLVIILICVLCCICRMKSRKSAKAPTIKETKAVTA